MKNGEKADREKWIEECISEEGTSGFPVSLS
jgi:hypothetical protein